MLRLLSLATIFFYVCAGCAPSLPRAQAIASARLFQSPSLRTITILPIDLAMEAEEPANTVSPEASHRAAERALPVIAQAVREVVGRRGWAQNELAWDGSVPAGPDGRQRRFVIDPIGIANLVDWLVQLGYAVMTGQRSAAQEIAIGPLPIESDATLFVGGYAHLHEDETHRAKLAKQVVIGIVVAALIVGIVVLIAKGGGGKLPDLGGGASGVARALTLPIELGAHLALAATRVALDVAAALPAGHVHFYACNPYLGVHAGVAYAARPGPALSKDAQRENLLALGATLVENRSGQILWTAAQPMAVHPADELELRHAVKHLLAELPRAR